METGDDFILEAAQGPGDEQADGGASQDIKRVMDADVDTGVGDNRGNPEKNRGRPSQRLGQK